MRRATLITILAAVMLVSAVAGAAVTARFSDVPEDHWAAEAIEWATDTGIIAGTGDGTFEPNKPVTRAQLAVILWKYDQRVRRPLTIAQEWDMTQIVEGYDWEWNDLEAGDPMPYTSPAFDRSYRWPDLYSMVVGLCSALDHAEGNFQAIPNWIEAQDWAAETTHEDRVRIVLYGVPAV